MAFAHERIEIASISVIISPGTGSSLGPGEPRDFKIEAIVSIQYLKSIIDPLTRYSIKKIRALARILFLKVKFDAKSFRDYTNPE